MSHVIWIMVVIGCSVFFYQDGFKQGDLDRRLRDVDAMVSTAENEMRRHFAEENYWNDRAWECEDKLKELQR